MTDVTLVCLQVFRGVHWSDDVFNHENVGFWHYLQPAYNVMGFISCAGTNFVIRSSAFAEAGKQLLFLCCCVRRPGGCNAPMCMPSLGECM